MSSFKLLKEKRFGPFFWTQASGAFNDNVFKTALGVLIAYTVADKAKADILIQISAALFVLPFMILSWITGQIADKTDKASLMRKIKVFEIGIMIGAFIGFYYNAIYALMFMLFLMGIHSSLFGPVKYSIIPQTLKDEELIGGNGLVAMATFLAILFGNIIGVFLVSDSVRSSLDNYAIAITVIAIAVVGYLFSRGIPSLKPTAPELVIKWQPIKETWNTIKIGMEKKMVWYSLLGVAWFWFFGFFFLANMPSYCKYHLAGKPMVASLLLTMFSIGIGLGSVMCEKIAKSKVEIGTIAMGALGLTIFAVDLFIVGETKPHGLVEGLLLTISEFLENPYNWRICFDLLMIGFCGGFYIVPLYAIIQGKSRAAIRSRVIAANNILDSIFMVAAAAFAILLFGIGLNIIDIFLVIALLNLIMAITVMAKNMPHVIIFFCRILTPIFYKLDHEGEEKMPEEGAVVVAINHVSFVDPVVSASQFKRPPRFMMDKSYFDDLWPLRFFFTAARTIPLVPYKQDPTYLQQAMDMADDTLKKGEAVALFPEGFITSDGEMISFKDGVSRLVERTPAPVLPVALCGLWGSWFSRIKGSALKGWPSIKEFRRPIGVMFGDLIPPEEVTPERVQDEIQKLKDKWDKKHAS